jgi:hypothetical protein
MEYEQFFENPFFNVTWDSDGRGFHVRLDDGIKDNLHHRLLKRYVTQIVRSGVNQFNVDHIKFEGKDRSLSLQRGKHRLDFAYIKDGRLYECEFKTENETNEDRTYTQAKGTSKYCEILRLIVPKGHEDLVNNNLILRNIHNAIVETYEP